MERFEIRSLALLPGQRVRAKILGRQPWGLIAEIAGYEDVGASVDVIQQFGGAARTDAELKALYPPVGAEIDAVVEQVLDVRSNDGQGSTTLISHRACLAGRIRREDTGEQARVLKVGRPGT